MWSGRAVQMHDRTRSATARPDHIHARMARRVLGTSLRGDVLNREPAPLEVVAEKMRAGVVLLARRVDGRDAHKIRRQLHELVPGAIDFRRDAIDEMHGSAYNNPMRTPLPVAALVVALATTADLKVRTTNVATTADLKVR